MLRQVADGVLIHESEFIQSNAVVVQGRAGVLLIDPGIQGHRNPDGSLCLWYPGDGTERRWVFEDGLPQLLAIVTLHLFKEAHWRRTGGHNGGEWLGDEVHEEQPKSSEPPPEYDAA